jgi:tRNA(adenine34) deaminase
MSSSEDLERMRAALAEAALAPEHADVPVGAIVVDAAGRLIGAGHNRREVDQDPTAHAEIIALRAASQARGSWRLDGATLFVTLEPCAMCAGALVNARIARVVYAASDPKAGALESLFTIGSDTRLNHRFEITAGVLPDLATALLQAFFRELRARGEK